MADPETPQTAATEHPTVLDIDVVGDRALASVEKGDVSVVVESAARARKAQTHPDNDGSTEEFEKVVAAEEAMLDE